MLKDKTLTYISLFSSAGVGCFGFKKVGFECIATNELIERRLNVQRFNNKCKYDSGYICADITDCETKDRIFDEIGRWQKLGNDRVDVLIATPPCQGMSVANHKKTEDEIVRNSLVVESIRLVQRITPRFFIFENVPAFMKTGCTAPDGTVKAIGDVIYEELGEKYIITDRILNFKNYGSNSSRTRALVIGVSSEMADFVAPVELYPDYTEEKTLGQVIEDMPGLEWGEICARDFYHAFRTYPEEMRCWIHDLGEGQGAFDNEDESRRPHKIVDGVAVPNIRKNGDKYTRQCWDRPAPCVHTRNDQLASQNTIHPREDRVFSIRELMKMMTIPDDFRWIDRSLEELNALPEGSKADLLKKEEIKIRQSIGEAVPTKIFFQIACRIRDFMEQRHFTNAAIHKAIEEYQLLNAEKLMQFLSDNPLNLGGASLARIAELTNSGRENNAAYYTNKFIVNEIYKQLPNFEKNEVSILEPSVGVGNFLPFLFKKYENKKRVNIDVVDIDRKNLQILELLLRKQRIPDNVCLNYIHGDTLLYDFKKRYDLVIGNPPFSKLKAREAAKYLENNVNQETTNTFEFFLEKALAIADHVVMIMPKAVLNTPEFHATRELLSTRKIDCIQDYGENGFRGVLVETVCMFVDTAGRPRDTKVESLTLKKRMIQKQKYITDQTYPYWIIYRDEFFDRVAAKLDFDRFTVFRDRQITNSNTSHEDGEARLRVLKSRNISDDGKAVVDIPGYDSYIDRTVAEGLGAYGYVGDESVYLTPNMTYKPRVMRNTVNAVVNGSVAVLIPKGGMRLTERQLAYFSSDEYRQFYRIARNYQTRSLNVDATSVFFYGVLKEPEGAMDALLCSDVENVTMNNVKINIGRYD
ncbi:MAG: DNA cytosine methyltransferase [Blautia sp.]|nr:DNA cytosine methyltransferase [Blautia sp.]